MTDKTSFGDLIHERREALGLSLSRLGELVGRSATTVRSWEAGRFLPSDAATLEALQAVLGIGDQAMAEAMAAHHPAAPTEPSAGPVVAAGDSPPGEVGTLGADEAAATLPGFPPAPVLASAPAPQPADRKPSGAAETPPLGLQWEEPAGADEEADRPQPALPRDPGGRTAAAEPAEAPAIGIGQRDDDEEEEGEDQDWEQEVEPTRAAVEAMAAPADSGAVPPPPVAAPPPVERADPSRVAPGGGRSGWERVRAAPEPAPSRDRSDEREAATVLTVPPADRAEEPAPVSTPPAPVAPVSYLDDPTEQQTYRIRAIATTIAVLVLIVVLFWALGRVGDAWSNIFGSIKDIT